ncbi:MAG: hypothetical protein JWN14_3417 [Chthonomonadales bacterium]|nr:hypothetical protein [Chthonomonadales bacterium]
MRVRDPNSLSYAWHGEPYHLSLQDLCRTVNHFILCRIPTLQTRAVVFRLPIQTFLTFLLVPRQAHYLSLWAPCAAVVVRIVVLRPVALR